MSNLQRETRWYMLALLMAIPMGGHTAVAQDSAAYQKACGDCHSAPGVIARKIQGETEEEKTAFPKALLAQHHTPAPDVIDQIIKYLLELPQR